MKILAIETSCDETALCIAEPRKDNFKILSSFLLSQIEIHKPYGGIYPTLAKREHQRNLVPGLILVLDKAGLLKKTPTKLSNKEWNFLDKIFEKEKILYQNFKNFLDKYSLSKIDLVAVTKGPGLEPCLWCGVNLASALAFVYKIPIVGVNHLEAHLFANFLEENFSKISTKDIFPAIGLIVSGGHTQLILIKKWFSYKLLGETRDDAAGEALDKIARILGLGYPGGPEIEKLASCQNVKMSKCQNVKLPRPMLYSKDYDFSFSGLKTAVLYAVKKQKSLTQDYISVVAKEVQNAIFEVLITKTLRAQKEFNAKSILLGGGVIANKTLQKWFTHEARKRGVQIFIPQKHYCTDNAEMVALAGFMKFKKFGKDKIETLKANAQLNI